VSEAEKAEILQLNRKTRKAKFKDLQIVFPAHVLKVNSIVPLYTAQI
jgi:hypothetical protein